MKRIYNYKRKGVTFLFAALLVCYVTPVFAVDLVAVERFFYPPGDVEPVKMWGFEDDTEKKFCKTLEGFAWKPGERIIAKPGDNLSITLRNCLSEPISIIIPGLNSTLTPQVIIDDQGRQRVRAFTTEVPANFGATSVTYTWNNVRAGTFLYQSGSHPAKQIPKGLYGAVTIGKNSEAITETILLFSEIDPDLNNDNKAATPLNYKPKYFLINGKTGVPGKSSKGIQGGRANKTQHIRFLNAGLMSHVPTIDGGDYMQVYAEDGYPYPYVKEQYSVLLPPGKTVDALWTPSIKRNFALYDRRLSMTTNGEIGGGMTGSLHVRSSFPWESIVPAVKKAANQ